jgi:HK97 family phage major capsid protein
MGGLKSAYHRNAIWVMSASTFFTLIQPLGTDANGLFVQDGIGYRLLGHRVVFSDACDSCKFKSGSTAEANNANHIIFGDFKNYVFNFGEGIAIEADSSVAFRSGSTVYRGMALCDGAVADMDAFKWTTIAAS